MSLLTSVYRDDHPLNTWFKVAAPFAAVALLGIVILMQQFTLSLHGSTLAKPPSARVASEELSPAEIDPFTLQCKSLVRYAAYVLDEDPDARGKTIEEAEPDTSDMIAEIESLAISRTDRLRLAIVLADVRGLPAGLDRLRKIREESQHDGNLYRDADWLITFYTGHTTGIPTDLPAEVQASLRARHAWFADLALSYGKHPNHQDRARVAGGFEAFAAFYVGYFAITALLLLPGLVMAVVLLYIARQGLLSGDIEVSGAPRQVYMETFCVFSLMFTFFLAIRVLFLGQRETWTFAVSEVLIWSSLASAFWPMFRGVSFADWATDMGLRVEGSWFKEILVGVTIFLVERPVLALLNILAAAFTSDSGESAVEGFPTFESSPIAGTWPAFVIGALGTIIWAPVLEELIFRGALHRYLEGKLNAAARVLITATAFGLYHPYDLWGMLSTFIGGLFFGLAREWRGTIIAAMVAHFLHNAHITLFETGTLLLFA